MTHAIDFEVCCMLFFFVFTSFQITLQPLQTGVLI